MRSHRTTKPALVRQPAAEGVDAVYNRFDRCYDYFVDAQYQGSRLDEQSALIAARQIHFDNIERARYELADMLADVCVEVA